MTTTTTVTVGPVIERVLAGPGSGKTQRLVQQILGRLEQGTSPAAIVGVTFTRRAAKEMQERLGKFAAKAPWLGTLHALARRILLDLRLLPTPLNLETLIPDATQALRAGKVPGWVRAIRYLAVDEAQDLDAAQVEFLQVLRSHTDGARLLLVGDPDQAIYHFRGASPRFLLQAPEVFGEPVATVTLAHNHRSARGIVETARALLSPVADPQAPCHQLAPVRPEAHPAVRWIETTSAEQEAVRIFEEVRTFLALGIRPADIAILVRVRAQLDVLYGEAARWAIPVYLPPLRDQLEEGQEVDPPADAVQLMTMHQSKGCEFTVVFLAGVQEGLMPHRRAVSDEARYEELRLLYVAITRAKQLLWFCHHGEPSRFLALLRGAASATPQPTRRGTAPRQPVAKPPAPTILRMLMGWMREGFGR
jgi:DNA helicase-2/ATP-dependent DNA helicase PcrA